MRLGRRLLVPAIVAGSATRSAAAAIPGAHSSNGSVVSSTHHTFSATPACGEINSRLQEVEENHPSQIGPVSRTRATNWNCTTTCLASSNSTKTADRKLNPTATEESATQSSNSVQDSTLATGWKGSELVGTATHRQLSDLSTNLNNGSTSASPVLVGLATTHLEPATDTLELVPTPQPYPGGREEQNVDPSPLSDRNPSYPTNPAAVRQGTFLDGHKQMPSGNDNDNTDHALSTAKVQPTPAMVVTTDSNNGVDKLVSVVNDAATTSAEPTDALEILLSALPSSVASSIEAQSSAAATDASTSFRTTSKHTSRSTTRPTSRPTTSSTRSTTTSSSSSSTITSSSSTLTSSTRSISSSSSTTSSAPSSTSTNAPPTGSSQLENSAIAGIATGVTAGAVIIILAIVFFLRRKQQGKPLFGPRDSVRSKGSGRVYPEVAWLYDPAPSPPNEPSDSYHPGPQHRRGDSGTSLLPPQPREPEMAAMGGYSSIGNAYSIGNPESSVGNPYMRSPELRPMIGPDSPLLPPNMPAVRAESPGASPLSSPSRSGSQSGSQSPRQSARSSVQSNGRRPLHAIFEESHAQ